MTNAELKARIEELEEQERKIADEIYHLRERNKGYWIGIGDNDYSMEYYRLGWCSETEAEKIMQENGDFVLGFSVREVTKEYNEKMYKAERLQNLIGILEDDDFSKYKETKNAMKKELTELKNELDIPTYCSIY